MPTSRHCNLTTDTLPGPSCSCRSMASLWELADSSPYDQSGRQWQWAVPCPKPGYTGFPGVPTNPRTGLWVLCPSSSCCSRGWGTSEDQRTKGPGKPRTGATEAWHLLLWLAPSGPAETYSQCLPRWSLSLGEVLEARDIPHRHADVLTDSSHTGWGPAPHTLWPNLTIPSAPTRSGQVLWSLSGNQQAQTAPRDSLTPIPGDESPGPVPWYQPHSRPPLTGPRGPQLTSGSRPFQLWHLELV